MKLAQALLTAAVLLMASGAAQATLIDRGSGLIYDNELNITWLADANYAMTSGYDADGGMTWSQAVSWAANLSYYDSVRNVTYADWRLPTMTDISTLTCNYSNSGTNCGFNSTGGEMSHLYYSDLGNTGFYNAAGEAQADYGLVDNLLNFHDESLFVDLKSSYYWYDTEYVPNPSDAWTFLFNIGHQGPVNKIYEMYAMAVRPGDVATATVPHALEETAYVPEPATLVLLGMGLAGLGWARRR